MTGVVYIAGPYTRGDPVVNVRSAIDAADALAVAGLAPFCPHLNMVWHLAHPHSPDFWYAVDLRVLRSCALVLRLPGDSSGADEEVAEARRLGLPVFFGTAEDFLRSGHVQDA